MADTFSVTASVDKASYNGGDAMTCALAGNVFQTVGSTANMVATVIVRASDGATHTIQTLSTSIVTPSVPLTFGIETITDNLGHSWTIAADGMSATASA